MPVSLLSPIAHDLRLTEGEAGQAISISGIFAVITSLSITLLAGKRDRKRTLIGLTLLLVISGTIVAFAPSYFILMVGRALLGVGIGGFWSMSGATMIRLVPEESVAKAVSILSGGIAVASVVAAPLGSFVGGLIGWRGAFFCVVPVALVAALWQAFALPAMPHERDTPQASQLSLLRQTPVLLGMLNFCLFFAGQYALYTYLRPFLEQVTHLGVSTLSVMLLILGLAGVVGTSTIGRFLDHRIHATLAALPALMAVVAVALALLGSSVWLAGALIALWGFAATAAPVGQWTWLTRTLPEDAEAGGGLMVAVAQMSITLGAALGGVTYDAFGPIVDFLGAGALLAGSALIAIGAHSHNARALSRA
jgi:predicted MFS family arabinose efflux permease